MERQGTEGAGVDLDGVAAEDEHEAHAACRMADRHRPRLELARLLPDVPPRLAIVVLGEVVLGQTPLHHLHYVAGDVGPPQLHAHRHQEPQQHCSLHAHDNLEHMCKAHWHIEMQCIYGKKRIQCMGTDPRS